MTGNISDEEMGHITHVEAELTMFIDKRAKEAERNEEARKIDTSAVRPHRQRKTPSGAWRGTESSKREDDAKETNEQE